MNEYQEIAQVYDLLMDHVDYSQVADFYLEAASLQKLDLRRVLDLACGTGTLTLELLKRGYEVHGIDKSITMLSAADKKIFGQGFTPNLSCQDMRDFEVIGTYDLIVSAFDSLNYIPSEEGLVKVFSQVNKALASEGLFIFDVHSNYKFEEALGTQDFIYSSDDIAYIWQNEYSPQNRECCMILDIFVQSQGSLYNRIQEVHHEYYYPVETLRALLEQEGFNVLAIYGDLSLKELQPNNERIFFVAQKPIAEKVLLPNYSR